jgi:hypothetical protein
LQPKKDQLGLGEEGACHVDVPVVGIAEVASVLAVTGILLLLATLMLLVAFLLLMDWCH